MTTLLKTAAITALITGFANSAQAGTPYAFQTDAELASVEAVAPQTGFRQLTLMTQDEVIQEAKLQDTKIEEAKTQKTKTDTPRVAVARVAGGRFIATPYSEEADWAFLDKRVDVKLDVLSAGAHFKYLPELDFQGVDTDNKIDEIRLTAANEGYSHVILYGMGSDAYWSSFGGKALSETGLVVHEDCDSWDQAQAKALLVDTHTGEVLGAAKADDVTHNIGYLADDMERVLSRLT